MEILNHFDFEWCVNEFVVFKILKCKIINIVLNTIRRIIVNLNSWHLNSIMLMTD